MAITFELTADKEVLEIILDEHGCESLMSALQSLQPPHAPMDHVHLKTKEWGGDELASDVMHKGNTLLHHVKIIRI